MIKSIRFIATMYNYGLSLLSDNLCLMSHLFRILVPEIIIFLYSFSLLLQHARNIGVELDKGEKLLTIIKALFLFVMTLLYELPLLKTNPKYNETQCWDVFADKSLTRDHFDTSSIHRLKCFFFFFADAAEYVQRLWNWKSIKNSYIEK